MTQHNISYHVGMTDFLEENDCQKLNEFMVDQSIVELSKHSEFKNRIPLKSNTKIETNDRYNLIESKKHNIMVMYTYSILTHTFRVRAWFYT